MPVLRLTEIHAAHVGRIVQLWAEGPSSNDPDAAAFEPMVVAVCRDRKKRTVERVMVARVPEERVEAARVVGQTAAEDGLRPFAVTQATETWLAPDDGGGAPSERSDRREALAVSTAQADGRSLTTVVEIERSAGGEPALGGVLVDAEGGFEAALAAEVFATYRRVNNGYGGGVLVAPDRGPAGPRWFLGREDRPRTRPVARERGTSGTPTRDLAEVRALAARRRSLGCRLAGQHEDHQDGQECNGDEGDGPELTCGGLGRFGA